MTQAPPKRRVRQIDPDDLVMYLRGRKWLEESTTQPGLLKFYSPEPIRNDGTHIDLFIPSSKKLVGHRELIEYAIKSISTLEHRSVTDVVNNILIFADLLKTRILKAKKGMIPLDRGVILYAGMRDLITFSASSELDPSAKRHTRGERAKKYANSSLIGQSEYGSYVANIYIPLDRPNKDFDFTADPFQRKVVLRILHGLEILMESIDEASPDPIIHNYKKGLNINMCDAVIGIIDAGMGNNVMISAILESAYSPPKDIMTEFTLTPKSREYLESAIDELKEKDKPLRKEGWWQGFPRLLDRPKTAKKGLVKLETVDADEGHINIYIKLNESDYQFCADANLKKIPVEMSGTLEKDGRKWVLYNPHDLALSGGKSRISRHPKQRSLKTFEKPET